MSALEEIALLKYQFSEMVKQHAKTESELSELRAKFNGYNSQFAQVKSFIPIMEAKYQELSNSSGTRIKTIDKKVELILKLTKERIEPSQEAHKVA